MIRIGTGGGGVAMALAAQAVDYLLSSEPKHEFQIVTVTMADEQGAAHSTPGGAAELISALQQREIDLAVLPGEAVPPALPDGVSVAAVADRVTPHDVLVTRAGMALADLPAGAAAGAADRARAVRVRALRRDLMPVVSRGELAAQLQTLKNGICAALLLAAADLVRLNVREPSLTMRPVTELLPAAGQGMLVLLARADDEENRSAAGRLDLMEFRLALAAEQECLRQLDATATTAGVLAEVDGEQMTISGLVLADGGAELARDTCTGALQEHLQLARWLAERLRRRLSAVS